MAASRVSVLLLLMVGCVTVISEDPTCRDIKKTGIKVNCPAWTDPNCDTCEWFAFQNCDGECGGGIRRESRSRSCGYTDEADRKKTCQDVQDRLVKCDRNCGPNGKYNEIQDYCECKEDFGGPCCADKIAACVNPVLLEGQTDRSTSFVGRGNRCDARLRPNWYRFVSPAGNLIPNECVPYGSCNTGVPFWLNGTHPRPQDGVVDRWVCGTQGSECCKHQLKIKVRNCIQYMAYYLVPTEGCMKAYCVGTHEQCPEGENSDTGFQPGCSNDFPDVKVTPTVGYYVQEEKDTNDLHLTCSAAYPGANQYLWKAQWFFDGEPGPIQVQQADDTSPQPKFALHWKQWKTKMGTSAQCTMQAKRRNGQGTWSQSKTLSQDYFLGITVAEKVINVKEGETAHVTLRSNLPVRCGPHEENIKHCELAISLTLDPTVKGPRCPGKPKEISQVVFHGDLGAKCGYRDITNLNWHIPAKLQLKPKLDIQLDKDQQRTLRMQVQEKDTRIPELWHGYVLPSVTINIIDTDDRGSCTLVNDPHIKTFDGRYYDFHDKPDQRGDRGIYVVYKHTKEDEEVQARFFRCNGRIFCICGVAIRAGTSTVVFDRCRTTPNLHPELNYQVQKPDKNNALRVFRHNSGTEYHVFLPTGAQVKVFSGGANQYIWIEVKASVEGKGKSVGLCGNYNNNLNDDLQDSQGTVMCQGANSYSNWCQDERFRNSWIVKEHLSIFAGAVPPHNPEEHMEEMFCDCVSEPGHQGYEECDYHKRYEPCDEGFELFNPKPGYSQNEFTWLENYQAPQIQNPAFDAAVKAQELHYYSSWAEGEWTEARATKYCTDFLYSSSAVTTCLNEVPDQNYNSSIQACSLDLVLTGSTEFAATHLEDIKSKCNQELRMNLELWEPREEIEGANGEKPVVVAGPPLRLTENLCPNECSGNGACDDGKCMCKKGFSSYDCSMRVDDVPIVKGVVSSGVACDRSKHDCSVIGLEGMKFLEGPQLTCHFYTDDDNTGRYFYSGPAPKTEVSRNPATLFSLWVVQCDVPSELATPLTPKTTYYQMQVAVSNNGQEQSDRAFYSSYDGRCETCNNKKCTKKTDTCIISSGCYEAGDENPENKNLVCHPTSNQFDWTDAGSIVTQPPDDVVCDGKPGEIVIHRDPKDCGKYYVCVGTVKEHMPCPDGLAFHQQQNKCLDPQDVPGCH